MAHNLNIENGQVAFVTAKEKAWHGLGTVLPEVFTSNEALTLGGLNFEVGKFPMHTRVKGVRYPVPNKFATVRMDNCKPLGVVGNYYTPLQNVDAFAFFDEIAGKGEAIYESAGALGDGETVFLTAKLPEYIKVPADVVEMYLILTNSHDGSRPLTAFFSPVKVVCNNTLNAALNTAKNRVIIRHTKTVKDRLIEAGKLMGIANLYTQEIQSAFDHMSKMQVTTPQAIAKVNAVMLTAEELKALAMGAPDAVGKRKQTIIDEVMQYYHQDSTLDGIRGTSFGVYNAITGYFQNVKEYKNAEVKMNSLILQGADYATQQKAFEVCMR